MDYEKVLILSAGFIYGLYLLIMLLITRGWFRLRVIEKRPASAKVSIAIAARNESKNILACLESIVKQDYPAHLIQIIVVDDASEDQTAGLVEGYLSENPGINLNILRLKDHGGKKAALALAIEHATGQWMITTDADCIAGPEWIGCMVSAFEKEQALFVSGPVDLDIASPVIDLLPGLEFMSLIASGAGAIGAGFPIMCNGANMGFSLPHYRQLPANAFNAEEASGDDVFLMQAFKKQFGSQRIAFAKSPKAIVYTPPPATLLQFIRQRLRWTSKSHAYRDVSTLFSAFVVLLMNLAVSLFVILSCFDPGFLMPTLLLIALKTLTDLPLLMGYAAFSNKLSRVALIPLAEPLVAIYITFTGIAGQFVNVKWKGRKV